MRVLLVEDDPMIGGSLQDALREAAYAADWVREDGEVATSRREGVRHVDFEISAVRDVPGPEAERLVQLMKDLPKPLLVHCRAGALPSTRAA